MALVKRITVDGEDLDIEDLTDWFLKDAVVAVDADIVATSLYEGKPMFFGGGKQPLHETEAYRGMRLGQLRAKRKALLLEAKRRKLEID